MPEYSMTPAYSSSHDPHHVTIRDPADDDEVTCEGDLSQHQMSHEQSPTVA